jgi:hypothetical protein
MSTASPANAASLDDLHVQAMNRALSALLDRVAGSRRSLPHLAALEISLKRNGLNSLKQASLPVLTKVSAQLAGMPEVPHDPALLSLQGVLLSALAKHRAPHPKAQMEDLGGGGVVEVSEVSHTDFLAIANAQPSRPVAFPDTEVLPRPPAA